MANYKDLSKKFFNAKTGKDIDSWADSAAAYFSSLAGKRYPNYAEAMAHYYGSANPATSATVFNGGTVSVVNSAGNDSHNATATVASGSLSNVKLAATVAMVDSTDTIPLQNSTGSVAGGAAVVTVAAGVPTNVRAPATTAVVPTGTALTGVTPTGTYTNTVTFTVAGGVITAIALS